MLSSDKIRLEAFQSLNKKEIRTYQSILTLLLDILSSASKEEYEKLILEFVETLSSYSTKEQNYSLKSFLKVIDENPFLCFMVKTRIRQISYEAQKRILMHMEEVWPHEATLIQKLSQIAYVDHLWIQEYGLSPFGVVVPVKFILKSLLLKEIDFNLQLEDVLAKPSDIPLDALSKKIKSIEVIVE